MLKDVNTTTVGIQNIFTSLVEGRNIGFKSDGTHLKSEAAPPNVSEDSITLSNEAIELSKSEMSVMGNGNGNEPPKVNKSVGVEAYGNGNGNEPANAKGASAIEVDTGIQGNGSGNEPPM